MYWPTMNAYDHHFKVEFITGFASFVRKQPYLTGLVVTFVTTFWGSVSYRGQGKFVVVVNPIK